MGYNYVFQWAIVLPLELVVAGLTLRFWDEDESIHVAVWVSAPQKSTNDVKNILS